MKQVLLSLFPCFFVFTMLKADANIDKTFKVTTHNVEVKESTESSLKLKTTNDTYSIKLEPNESGSVIFSLSGIGVISTQRFANLSFIVNITGFANDEKVYPTFSLDDVNNEINANQNTLTFKRIQGSIPVWFNEEVDSIQINYSNSLSANVEQFLRIHDLRTVESIDISSNPNLQACQNNNVMFALDGSSSIDKSERKMVARQLISFARKSNFQRDSTQLCIMEFGSKVRSVTEAYDEKEIIKALGNYKRFKKKKKDEQGWTNWSAAFDEAIKRKPELFVFITDGWSNWDDDNPSTFAAVYRKLIEKSNVLKDNGTRLLFITSEMDTHQNSKSILSNLLNSKKTKEIDSEAIRLTADLSNVDLVTMNDFSRLDEINLSSAIKCKGEAPEPIQLEEAVTASLDQQ